MYQNILVALDGSPFGEHALPFACGIAGRAGAKLTLMHVHPPLEPAYTEFQLFDSNWEKRVRDQENQYLDGIAKRVRDAVSSGDVSCVLKEGYVANAIREHCTLTGVDLVVLTTHARGPMGRFWLGSISDELVRTLAMPLLLVRPVQEQANLKQERAFENIVLALDGTPLAEQIIEPAALLGQLFETKVHLVRVVKPIMASIVPVGFGTLNDVVSHMAQDIEKAQAHLQHEAGIYLDKMSAKIRDKGLDVEASIEIEEQPGVGILRAVERRHADIVALATHGRRGLSRMFLGSVSDKVVRGATIPVLVQKPAGK